MKSLVACALLLFATASAEFRAQALTASASAAPVSAQPKATAKDPVKTAVAVSAPAPGQAITTEIFADEAFFDSPNHIGIFTGHVVVNDPRFNVQSDKLTLYLSATAMNGQQPAVKEAVAGDGKTPAPQGFDKAVAEGNVGVVSDRADEKGGPPVRTVARAEMAIYTATDGNVELRGTPRVQSGFNTHVATSPPTVMVLNRAGQLATRGPSRTEIRQEPKTDQPKPVPAKP